MGKDDYQKLDFGFVSVYLVKAEKGFALVDTGMGGHRAKLEAALARSGCGRGDLRLVIITHADYDHAGNAEWLRETFGDPIAIHAGDAEMLETRIAPCEASSGGSLSQSVALIVASRSRTCSSP